MTEKYTVFKYCKATDAVLPINEARRLDSISEHEYKRTLANIAHGYISDEMDAVAHPGERNGRRYTSKSKFREVTRALGLEEVGTAYDNGYNPDSEGAREMKNHSQNVMNEVKERLRHG